MFSKTLQIINHVAGWMVSGQETVFCLVSVEEGGSKLFKSFYLFCRFTSKYLAKEMYSIEK